MGTFRKAERKQAKARVALIGASGSGKTFSSILVALGLVGDGKKVAMIDTERGSGEMYSHLGDYDVMQINAPYAPNKLIDAIHEAEKEGYDVLIIDSLSPFWNGEGGLLEIKNAVEKRGKNSWAAWADVTPLYNRIFETIVTSPMHIVATMRSKAEYVVDATKDKLKVTKVGTSPVQREGAEFEFTIVFTMDQSHTASVSKDRTGLFDNTIIVPSMETGKTLRKWLESGAEYKPEEVEPEPKPIEMEHDIPREAPVKVVEHIKEDDW